MKAIGTVRCPLLIGRDDLLELVDRRLQDVIASRGQFLLVAGEAGVGKSRLLEALDQKARDAGFATSWGYVAPQDRDVPAASILDLARNMARKPLFAALGLDLLALRDATLDAEHVRRRQLVMDIVDRIRTVVTGPTLLGFDDLQWTDDLSLEVIAELARHAQDLPLLIAAGYRTDEAPPGTSLRDWRSRLITQRLAEEVRLAPLGPAETALVTTLILDTGLPAPRDVASAVYERTDGIPLHIEELLGALNGQARASGAAILEAMVPDTIEDAVMARLAMRSGDAQALARAGAVIGRCFVPEVAAGILDVPVEAIDGPLKELVDHFILTPSDARGLHDFRHQLLRDAIYRSIPFTERRKFHARAGEFGAQLEGQHEIHASLHYERAGLRREAYDAALAGGREAARLSMHREAFELYRRAVDHLPDDLTLVERGTVLAAYADEAGAIEELDIAIGRGMESAAAFRAAGQVVRAIEVMGNPISVWRRMGRPLAERVTAIKELQAELETLPDTLEARVVGADLRLYLAIARIDGRDLDEARRLLESTRPIGDEVGDPEYAMVVDWKTAVVNCAAGDVTGGLQRVGAVAHEAERLGYEDLGVSAFRDAATIATGAMQYDAAAYWLKEGLRYADSIEQSHCAHVMSATSAMVAWAGAEWTTAQETAGQAVADRGCRLAAEMARWALGFVALGRGEFVEARDELEKALAFGIHSEIIDQILPPLWGLAEAALLGGDPATAVSHVRMAREHLRWCGELVGFVPFVVTGARALVAAGDVGAAAEWVEDAATLLEPLTEVAGPAIEHGRGLVEMADGATGLARVRLEAAVRGWDERGRAWESAWARLDLAHCLIRSNRYAEGLALAVDVRETASGLDSRPLADRATVLQRMARGHVADEEPWRPLTAREFEVARLITEGRTNAEIAGELGIAPKTASSHVEHILAKLGASRRAEIAAWASHVNGSAAPR